jgi:hypothetical protein
MLTLPFNADVEARVEVLERLSFRRKRGGGPARRLERLENFWLGATFVNETPEQRVAGLEACVFGLFCRL